MLQRIFCYVVLCLSFVVSAHAGEKPQEFSGRLIELALGAPGCGTLQLDTLAVYDQVEGAGLPARVYVVFPCIELPRRQLSRSAGNLDKFVIGARHRVQVTKTAPAHAGSLYRGTIDPGSAPIFYATKVDPLIGAELGAYAVGDLNLGTPGQFAASLQEAVRAVAQSVGQPQEYYAQIEPRQTTGELIFHLWHKDAFLPKNKGLAGNPGGKCQDVYYHPVQKKVVRTLRWQ